MAEPAAGGIVRAGWELVRAQARSQAAYRASFLFDLVGNLGATAFDVVTVLVLFRVSRTVGGFTLNEALVMVGIAACAFATADLCAGSVEKLGFYVRTGQLDAILLRPLPALLQIVTVDLQLRRLSRCALGLAVYVIALARAHVAWTAARAALAVVAPLAGVLFFSAIFVAGATVAFWWIGSGEIANAFTYGGRDFTSYPVTVYAGWFRRVFAYGLGFAFVAYYPALALLGRTDPLGLPGWVGWAAPAAGVVAATLAAVAWRIGIRHYRSTGS